MGYGVDENSPQSDWSEFAPPNFGTPWGPAKLPAFQNNPNADSAASSTTTQSYVAGSLVVLMLASVSNTTTPPTHTIDGGFAGMSGELLGSSTVVAASKSARISWYAVFAPGGSTAYTPATVGGASASQIQPYVFAAADIAASIVVGNLAGAIKAGSNVGATNAEGYLAQPVVASSHRGSHVINAVIYPDVFSSTFAPPDMTGLISTWFSGGTFGTASQASTSEAPQFTPWAFGAANVQAMSTAVVVPGAGPAKPGLFVPWLKETPRKLTRPAELRGAYNSTGNQTSLNVTFQNGDHVYLVMTSTDAATPTHTILPGYTLVGTTTVAGTSNNARTSVAKYIASSSGTVSLTPFGTTAAYSRICAFVVVGASAGSTPIVAIAADSGGGGKPEINPPSVSTSDGSLVLLYGFLFDPSGAAGTADPPWGTETDFTWITANRGELGAHTVARRVSSFDAPQFTPNDDPEYAVAASISIPSAYGITIWDPLVITAGSYSSSGSPLALRVARKLAPVAGSYELSGSPIALRAARKLAPTAGSYSLSGSPVSLRAARQLVPSAGSYALTGSAVALRAALRVIPTASAYSISSPGLLLSAARKLGVSSGSYALTGSAVGLRRGYTLSPQAGAYALAGSSIALRVARVLVAQAGSYALAGQPIGLSAARRLELQQGDYSLAGASIAMRRALAMLLEAGSYGLSGFEVILLGGRDFSLLAGSYALTGGDIELRAAQRVQVQAGAYELEGFPVFLSYSGGEKTLVVDPGAYLLSGSPIDLRLSRWLELGLGAFSLQGSPLRIAAARVLSLGEGSYELDGFPLSWSIFTSGATTSNMGSALVSAHNGTAQGGAHRGRAGVRPHRGSVKPRGG